MQPPLCQVSRSAAATAVSSKLPHSYGSYRLAGNIIHSRINLLIKKPEPTSVYSLSCPQAQPFRSFACFAFSSSSAQSNPSTLQHGLNIETRTSKYDIAMDACAGSHAAYAAHGNAAPKTTNSTPRTQSAGEASQQPQVAGTEQQQTLWSTQCLQVNPHDIHFRQDHCDASRLSPEGAAALQQACSLLHAGEVVAIPTETVYGLAANALNASAVRKIFLAKNRPQDNPLIIHISSLDMLRALYPPSTDDGDDAAAAPWQLPAAYAAAVQAFWPGPLTILVPRSPLVPEEVTAGQPTMAVRLPSHSVARALIAQAGFPLAAPSANSSGRPSPTLARHVLEDLNGRIPLVLDGGLCDSGVESTVLDALRVPPVVLRPGGITYEQLAGLAGLQGLQVYRKHFVDAALEQAPTTPGMKYRHYSPRAQVVLLDLQVRQSSADAAATTASTSASASAPATASQAMNGGGAQPAASDIMHQRERSLLQAAVQQELAALIVQQRGDDAAAAASAASAGDSGAAANSSSAPFTVGILRTSLPGLEPGTIVSRTDVGIAAVTASGQLGSGSGALSAPACGAAHANGNGGQQQQAVVIEYVLGDIAEPHTVARELFRALRAMDEAGASVVIVEGVHDSNEGLAIMNRLRKAANRVVNVHV